MSKVVSTVLQIGSIALQFVPQFAALSWALRAAITIGLNVGAMLTVPKIKQQARQASATSLSFGEVPRAATIGLPE
jgi:hypothetical protein